jgi:hypothetical protein
MPCSRRCRIFIGQCTHHTADSRSCWPTRRPARPRRMAGLARSVQARQAPRRKALSMGQSTNTTSQLNILICT